MTMKMNKKYLSFLMSAAMLIMATACNYDEKDELDGKGLRLIRLRTSGTLEDDSRFPTAVAAFNPHETKGIVTINRDAISNSDLNTSTSVDVTILGQSGLDALNAAAEANGADYTYEVLPTDSYTVEGVTGSTFTFGPGEAIKELQIKLDPTESYDFAAHYILPIQLSNVPAPYTLSATNNIIYVSIVLKNIYDGIYVSTGTRYNYSSVGAYPGWDTANDQPLSWESITGPWEFEYPVSTVNETTSTSHAAQLDGGFGTLNLTVNPDNTVTITPNATTGVTNVTDLAGGPVSTYDPETKTFNLYYQYTNQSGATLTSHRVLHNILVYSRPQ